MSNNKKIAHNSIKVKISGGSLRGRNINCLEVDGLRPTSARIRETLFNWLHPVIEGKTCVDLFAGSGILGFEALSRGAKKVVFAEKNTIAKQQLNNNIKLLVDSSTCVIKRDYREALNSPADVIFLDPPYNLRLLPQLLIEIQSLSPSYVYIEDNRFFEEWIHEQGLYQIIKSKKAGRIFYGLLTPI